MASKPEFAERCVSRFQGDVGVKSLIDDLSRDAMAFARDGFAERAQHGKSVTMRPPAGAPDDRCVGDVLEEEGGEVWAVVDSKFGIEPGLRAGWASLLSVRGADRDVQGGVRVAEDEREDVGGPEMSATDEAGNLGLNSVITRLGSSKNKCGDRLVAAAGCVGGACVKGSGLSRSTGYRFAGPGASQAQTDRRGACEHPSSPRSHAPEAAPVGCPCQRRR